MKGLLLLSGGFDSPVAGYLMSKKGHKILAVHFSNMPFTDRSPLIKSRKLSKVLGFEKFISKDLAKGFSDIARKCERKYYFVLSKRLMMREAEMIAIANKCDYLLTGDNLGQVSSQTLSNLYVIDKASTMPVLRPLIGMDKNEIIDICKDIGIYDIAKGKECCDALGPEHPCTVSNLEKILDEENKLKT